MDVCDLAALDLAAALQRRALSAVEALDAYSAPSLTA
jgi:hypothetical protein